jgi:hypothetical protein
VAINTLTRQQRRVYEQYQSDRVDRLKKQISHDTPTVMNEILKTTCGLHWVLFMLESHLLTVMSGDTLNADQRLELIRLFGLMPHMLILDRDVMQIQLDCLSLQYGQGGLTAAQASELLDNSRGARTPEDFARRLEPHLAGMVTKEEARQYLITMIQKRRDALTALLPAAQAREDHELAREIAFAKCDVSDSGYRHEQYQSMADCTRHRARRDFHALQAVRRKFGGGDPEEPPPQEPQALAETCAVEDTQTAPPAEAAPAADAPNKNGLFSQPSG